MSNDDIGTRAEHLAWCKARALEELEGGSIENAVMSMCSDLEKHSETAGHAGIMLGMMQLLSGLFRTSDDVRRWIEGFN